MRILDLVTTTAVVVAAISVCVESHAADPLPINTTDFRIPFQIDAQDPAAVQGEAILFASVNGGPMELVKRVSAAEGGFDFAAPADGRYGFTVRITDGAGNIGEDSGPLTPELEVIVDRPLKSDHGYYLISPTDLSEYAPAVAFREWILSEIEAFQAESGDF